MPIISEVLSLTDRLVSLMYIFHKYCNLTYYIHRDGLIRNNIYLTVKPLNLLKYL